MAVSTRQLLIDTAFELFGRSGFHAVGLDQILDAVGVSKQTFYNHFESKDELILAVLRYRHEVEDKIKEGLVKAHGGGDPRAVLYATCDLLEARFAQPDWRGCIFLSAAAEFPSKTEPAHQAAAEHERESLQQLQYLATLAGARDPKALAEELSLVIEGVVAYRHVTGDERATQIARPAVQALLERHLPPVAAPTRAPKLRATPPDRPAAARRGTQKQRA